MNRCIFIKWNKLIALQAFDFVYFWTILFSVIFKVRYCHTCKAIHEYSTSPLTHQMTCPGTVLLVSLLLYLSKWKVYNMTQRFGVKWTNSVARWWIMCLFFLKLQVKYRTNISHLPPSLMKHCVQKQKETKQQEHSKEHTLFWVYFGEKLLMTTFPQTILS